MRHESDPWVRKIPWRRALAIHSRTLAWKIPWMEEPGRLQSMGSLRVGHDWVTSLSLFTFMHWRRKWQPSPVFLPGESQGLGSLVGCHLWGHTESHNWSNLAAAAAFLPGESHGEAWWATVHREGRESDTTEATEHMCVHTQLQDLDTDCFLTPINRE